MPKGDRNLGRRATQKKKTKETNFPNGQFAGRNSKVMCFHFIGIYHYARFSFTKHGE